MVNKGVVEARKTTNQNTEYDEKKATISIAERLTMETEIQIHFNFSKLSKCVVPSIFSNDYFVDNSVARNTIQKYCTTHTSYQINEYMESGQTIEVCRL